MTSPAVRALITMCLLALACCKPPEPERPPRKLTLGLSWVHSVQYSGPYYADRHGLYAKEGLQVELVPASADRDPLDELIDGKYDFVIAQPDTLIRARLKGHRLKAIAVTYHIHPLVFMSLESSGIREPRDFRGKTIGVAYSEKLLLEALLRKVALDPAEVTTVQRPYHFDDLLTGAIDVQAGWLTAELVTARRAGLRFAAISPYDYGITFYADVLAARESLIESDPKLVEKLVRATQRGWIEALQAPEESAKLALRYDPELDLAHQVQVLESSAPLIHTGVDPIGWMRARDWEEMIETLYEEGVIQERIPAADVFTTRFLEAARAR